MENRYQVTLTGATPLLMHRDNLAWEEYITKWRTDPANKKLTVPGDDRAPAWSWIGYTYFADGIVAIDSDNLMAMLRDAGKKCPAGNRSKATLKAATQSGIFVNEIGWPLVSKKGTILQEAIESLDYNPDFATHEKTAIDLGFELFVKRAGVGTKKHVRVRPRFDVWSATGSITVLDDTLTPAIINTLFAIAGRYIGMCDWRPGSPVASGRFGMFSSEVEKL